MVSNHHAPQSHQPPDEPVSTEAYQRTMLQLGRRLVEQRQVQASDRRVANVGEYTQSVIAVLVVVTTCWGVIRLHEVRMPPEFWTIVGLVIGFYFGRNRPLGTLAVRNPLARERVSDPLPPERPHPGGS